MSHEQLRVNAWAKGYDAGRRDAERAAAITLDRELNALFDAALLMLKRGRKA